MKSIYDYKDHLILLTDKYKVLKKEQNYLSHRYISQKLEQNSSSIFSHLLSGRMKISDIVLEKLTVIFKFTEKEAEYFAIIVHLNQSSTYFEKIYNINKLIKFVKHNSSLFTKKHYESCLEQYFYPLNESLSDTNLNDYYNDLASYLVDPVKEIEFITIQEDKNQYLNASNKDSLKEKAVTKIRNYYYNILEFSKIAAFVNELDLSSFFIKISPENFEIIKKEVIKCCKKIKKISNNYNKPVIEYRINFQSIPILLSIYEHKKFLYDKKIYDCLENCKIKAACVNVRKYYLNIIKLAENAFDEAQNNKLDLLSFSVNIPPSKKIN